MSDRLAQLEKLHAADPRDPFCTYGIALEHAKAQRYDVAVGWLDKTLELDAGYCYAYYQKGRILSQAGNVDAARQTLKTGISTGQRLGTPDTLHAAEEMTALLDSLDD